MKTLNYKYLCLFSGVLVLTASCRQAKKDPLFTALPASQTGILFNNTIDEAKFSKRAMNEFGYMGGGVGIGDFNNDGLKDVFLCGNQVSSRLYINKGSHRFEDITTAAGVETHLWCTGVSVVDINNDGYDDIYVCNYGKDLEKRAPNLLFINQRNNSFKEMAAAYGLADTSYSTQAAFFDYDRDGDLDMYLANYLLNTSYSANYILPKDVSGRSAGNDRLYRNDGNSKALGHPVFTDVSKEAGIKDDGYGLGLSVSDFNNDGWPDVYVCNDFVSNDNLWLNNRNGTFTNTLDQSTRHQSYSSMGCDAADINNDRLIDFASVDMMPEDNERKKLTYLFMNYERYEAERSLSYSPEFMRNMLQLNNGNYYLHDTAIPFFSDIGQLAGISETDWSWSILFADFNNDGFKDVHITNGIGRDFINSDFLEFTQTVSANASDPAAARKMMNEKLVDLNHVNLPNYLYLNKGNYTFANQSAEAGINDPSVSGGAAYTDLDNDGDLDLIVNNINKEPFVFINNTIREGTPITTHSIGIVLKGDSLNTKAFGAKVYVYGNGQSQVQEQAPARGYISGMDTKLIFGLGNSTVVDSVVITWPGQKQTVYKQLKADSVYTFTQTNDAVPVPAAVVSSGLLFTDVTNAANIHYKHTDVSFYDYSQQRLLPQKFSQLGPYITSADINHDGLTDLFVGGAFNSYGQILTQQPNGSFSAKNLYDGVKMREDMDCVFFDADGDSDADLLITYSDMRYEDTSTYYRPQLFLNNGQGSFTLSENAVPGNVKTIAGCVAKADYDSDGDMDIFIGGRVSKQYPLPPRSYLLQNNKGVFTDVTAAVCPALVQAGMVTAAAWADIDNDKKPDLVLAGEWMPVRFFKNNSKQLTEITGITGLTNMNGMWRSLVAADMDNDGDMDFVAGNLGLNCKYHVTEKEPMKLYAKDIDGNGSIDPVLFYYIKNKSGERELFPAIGRAALADQVPSVKKMFLKHEDFVNARMTDIFKNKEGLLDFTCAETAHCWIENTGNGKFVKHLLPQEAQFAPVNAIVCADVDGDGVKDIIVAGNEYQTEVMTGRYDASYGLFLKGATNKTFTPLSPVASGFMVNGDVKDMELVTNAKKETLLVVAVNNDFVKVFRVK
jgi:enediyne biosynthesis protein E4